MCDINHNEILLKMSLKSKWKSCIWFGHIKEAIFTSLKPQDESRSMDSGMTDLCLCVHTRTTLDWSSRPAWITGKPAGHAVTLPEELEEAFGLVICQCLTASVSIAFLCCWQSVTVCFSPQRAVAWFTVWGQCNKFWVAIQHTQAHRKPESLVWFAWHATGPSGPR